jgi:pimeloyl-ACP methyl ester carboxylesterase
MNMIHPDLTNWLNQGHFFTHKGLQIFYRQQGVGDDLLVLHGYPYSSFEWKDTIAQLANHYRVTTLDLLGMGFSDKPKRHTYSYEEHAEIINALLNHLAIRSVHVFAHDLGVSVGQELLARDGEGSNKFQLRSMAFMNGGLFMDVYRPRLIQRLLSQSPDWAGKLLSKALSKKAIERSVRSVFGRDTQPDDAFMDKQWEVLTYNDGKAITYLIGRLVFDKYRYQTRWISAMQQTSVPMCYICGPADPNSGLHMAKRYEERIPSPVVYRLSENIGHWPQLEDQAGVLAAFGAFIHTV